MASPTMGGAQVPDVHLLGPRSARSTPPPPSAGVPTGGRPEPRVRRASAWPRRRSIRRAGVKFDEAGPASPRASAQMSATSSRAARARRATSRGGAAQPLAERKRHVGLEVRERGTGRMRRVPRRRSQGPERRGRWPSCTRCASKPAVDRPYPKPTRGALHRNWHRNWAAEESGRARPAETARAEPLRDLLTWISPRGQVGPRSRQAEGDGAGRCSRPVRDHHGPAPGPSRTAPPVALRVPAARVSSRSPRRCRNAPDAGGPGAGHRGRAGSAAGETGWSPPASSAPTFPGEGRRVTIHVDLARQAGHRPRRLPAKLRRERAVRRVAGQQLVRAAG